MNTTYSYIFVNVLTALANVSINSPKHKPCPVFEAHLLLRSRAQPAFAYVLHRLSVVPLVLRGQARQVASHSWTKQDSTVVGCA